MVWLGGLVGVVAVCYNSSPFALCGLVLMVIGLVLEHLRYKEF